MDAPRFELNHALDCNSLAAAYRDNKRLHVPDFLPSSQAERLLASLANSDAWTLVMNQGEQLLELDRHVQAGITAHKQAQIDEAVYSAASRGFQFRYENIRVSDGGAISTAAPPEVAAFARFLCSEPVLSFVRDLTGAGDINFADARATRYGPGHFLTAHDDDARGQTRRVAYVFNLTKAWQADWGGLLAFPDPASRRVEAFVPAFNAMNLFTVRQLHSVSLVAPFAAGRRFSITGWFHAGPPS